MEKKQKKKQELIFVPAPGVGHLVSTLEFAKQLVEYDDQIIITVVVIKFPSTTFVDSYIKSLTASQPNIQLIDIPPVIPPPPELLMNAIEAYTHAFIESCKPHVKSILSDIVSARSSSNSVRVAALVLDLFCVTLIDVGNEFNLPSYIFFTSNVGFLNMMLYLPGRHEQVGREFRDSDPEVPLAGFANPVPARVLPSGVFNTDGAYTAYVKFAERFKDARGIIVNTFKELEFYGINSVSDGKNPTVYPVGPVLNPMGQPHPELDKAQWEKTMEWLDQQPQSSVLFLCFGSHGGFSPDQVEEIAIGIEKSGYRFLWSLRAPPEMLEEQQKTPEEMLPPGFLERTGNRGRVCGWVSQVEVLAHKAIGGFMSHCGWNSILESLWFGVPIVTFPIYAEQQLNAFLMVKELGLAVELRLDYRKGQQLVKADEIERAVGVLMGSEGDEVRMKVKAMAEMARKGLMEGGSSSSSIVELIKDITSS